MIGCVSDSSPFRSITPETSNIKSDRRISGYGVSSEDLIISDDDTESVDFDKASIEYHCYSEEDYSDDSEQEDSEYEKENSETMAVEEMHDHGQTDETKYDNKGKGDHTKDSTHEVVRLPGVMSLVPDSTPSRNFSIGSLMNDTLEALGSKRESDVDMANTKNDDENKDEKKATSSKPLVSVKITEVQRSQTKAAGEGSSSSNTPKTDTTKKPSPTMLLESDSESESDSDEAPEELDIKGFAPWNTLPIPLREMEKSSIQLPTYSNSIDTSEAVKSVEQTITCKPTAQTVHTVNATPNVEAKSSDLFDVEKSEWRKQGTLAPTVLSSEAVGYPKIATPPQKNELFAAMRENQAKLVTMRENQAKLVSMMREQWPKAPEYTSEGLHPPPLPWVRSCFASSDLAPTSQQPNTVTEKSNSHDSKTSQPSEHKSRKPHLFERLLLSEEAKARTEKLEKLKAVVYNQQGKRDVSFNPWSIGDDEDLDDTYYEAHNLFATKAQAATFEEFVHPDKVKPRGFAISNLVDDQPATTSVLKPVSVGRNWVAEKVPKDTKEHQEDTVMTDVIAATEAHAPSSSDKRSEIISHISPARGTKRKFDTIYDDMNDDKIVQDPVPVEEKIAETPVDISGVDLDTTMREVSQEKEICEETVPATKIVLNEPMGVVALETRPRLAGSEQPSPKRARIFTTGFALGAVTGAVGVFAALIASAP